MKVELKTETGFVLSTSTSPNGVTLRMGRHARDAQGEAAEVAGGAASDLEPGEARMLAAMLLQAAEDLEG